MVFDANNLTVSLHKNPTGVGCPLTGTLFFVNQDTQASPEYEIAMIRNSYFQPCKLKVPRINPGGKSNINFTLMAYGSRTVEDIPAELEFELLLNNSQCLISHELCLN